MPVPTSWLPVPGQTVDVAKNLLPGGFTSVKAALDYIAGLGDASASKPYSIRVFPGIYNEDPFTLIPFVSVVGQGSGYMDVKIQTTNNSADFINTVPSSSVHGVAVKGPTGAGFATFRHQVAGMPAIIDNVFVTGGYYGLLCDPVAGTGVVVGTHLYFSVGSGMQNAVRVINKGFVNWVIGTVGGAPGSVVQGVHVEGPDAEIEMDTVSFSTSGGTDHIFIDNDTRVRINSCTLYGAAANGIHIGGSGVSNVKCIGTSMPGVFTKDILVDSSATMLTFLGQARPEKVDCPGGSLVGTIAGSSDSTFAGQTTYGELFIQNPIEPNAILPIGTYIRNTAQTGTSAGGVVTRTSGLEVHVTAGTGFISDSLGSIHFIQWADTDLTLTGSQQQSSVIVDLTGTVVETLVDPDPIQVILLANAATDVASITLLESSRVNIWNSASRDFTYRQDVVGPISVSGGAIVKHDVVSLQLDIDSGTCYIANVRKDFTASAPATWTRWYRNNSGGWNFTTNTSSIDTEDYDDGSGILASVPAGKFTRHLMYVVVGDDGTEFHKVFAQEYFDSALLAIDNPNPPDVLLKGGCRLAAIVVQQGVSDIAEIVDQRPKIGQLSAGGTAVTVHGQLSGLSANDHLQYQLRTEKGSPSGYAPLDASQKVPVANLNTATAPSGDVYVGASDTGVGPRIAFEDHEHSLQVASPIALVVGDSNHDGVSVAAARGDHQHALPAYGSTAGTFCQGNDTRFTATATPQTVNVTGAATGTGPRMAFEDHNHSVSVGSPAVLAIGSITAAGVATSLSKSDHVHQMPTFGAVVASTVGGVNVDGVSVSVSHADHVHSLPAFGTTVGTFTQGNDTRFTATATPQTVTVTGAATGTGPRMAFEDHNHSVSTGSPAALAIGGVTAAGVATSLAKSDHAHQMPTFGSPVATVVGGANTDGTSASVSHADHVHALPAYGSIAGTFCQGNDARLSDDRTASGLRTATTVVSISGATAPTAGQILKATSGTGANWQQPSTVQTQYSEITTNTTTTSGTFVDLLTVSITTGATSIIIQATGSASNTNANQSAEFRITLDGVAVGGGANARCVAANVAAAFAITKKVSVSAAAHTVKLQWLRTANTARIDPSGSPDTEHASLLVQEVTV